MSNLETSNTPTPKETERTSDISLSFLGYEHLGQNLEMINTVVPLLSIQLQTAQDPKTLVFENAIGTPSINANYKKQVEEYGFKRMAVAHAFQKRTGKSIGGVHGIDEVITAIDSKRDQEDSLPTAGALNQIVKSGLLLPDELQDYFMGESLDKVRANFNFQIDRESHSPAISQREQRLLQQSEEAMRRGLSAWGMRNFDDFLKNTKDHYIFAAQGQSLRDQDLADQFKTSVKKMNQSGDKGYIGFLFGRSHFGITEAIRRKLGPKFIPDMPTTTTESSVLDRPVVDMQRNIEVSDEAIAQSFLAGLWRGNVRGEAADHGKAGDFALEYQSVMDTLDQICQSTPLDRIKQMCIGGERTLDYLRKHPQVGPAAKYL